VVPHLLRKYKALNSKGLTTTKKKNC
jgi:hypothetical protein